MDGRGLGKGESGPAKRVPDSELDQFPIIATIPKSTDFTKISDDEVQKVEDLINGRPPTQPCCHRDGKHS